MGKQSKIIIAFLGVAVLVSACDQQPNPTASALSRQHCWAGAVFMLKKIAQTKKISDKDQLLGNLRKVRVNFQMIPPKESWSIATPTKGEIVCTYAYHEDTEINAKAAKALDISLNGTKLSQQQIKNLNTMINLIGRGL